MKLKKKKREKPSILMISCNISSSDNILRGDRGRGTNKQQNKKQVVSFTSDSFFFLSLNHPLQSKTPFISILLIENNNNKNRTGQDVDEASLFFFFSGSVFELPLMDDDDDIDDDTLRRYRCREYSIYL